MANKNANTKGAKPIYKNQLFLAASFIIFILLVFYFAGDIDGEKRESDIVNSTEELIKEEASSSSNVEVKEELNEQQLKTLDSLNDFNLFANNYANVEPIEQTVFWDDYIYGTKVTWTGTVVEVWSSKIILIDSNYYDGTLFNDLDRPDLYRVFIAAFNYDLAPSSITPGEELTVSGDLDSRGNSTSPFANWKLYNSEIIE